jgi:hypothetical protein
MDDEVCFYSGSVVHSSIKVSNDVEWCMCEDGLRRSRVTGTVLACAVCISISDTRDGAYMPSNFYIMFEESRNDEVGW